MTLASHFSVGPLARAKIGDLVGFEFRKEFTLAIVLNEFNSLQVLGILAHTIFETKYISVRRPSLLCLNYGGGWKITPSEVIPSFDPKYRTAFCASGAFSVSEKSEPKLCFEPHPEDQSLRAPIFFDVDGRKVGESPSADEVLFKSWEIWMPKNPALDLPRESILTFSLPH